MSTIYRLYLCLIPMILWPCMEMRAQQNAEIRKINFKGNKTFKNGELLDVISYEKTSWIGKTFFKDRPSFYSEKSYELNLHQLKSFYQSEGFLDVEINETPDLKINEKKFKVDITFHITENEPVTTDTLTFQTEVEGDSLLDTRDWERLKRNLNTRKNKRFRDEAVKTDEDLISTWFSSRGYAYADATPEIDLTADTSQAIIHWRVHRGPFARFGEISIKGEKRTPVDAIRKQFAIKEGEPYSVANLDKTQTQIYEMGLFRIVSVKAQLSREQKESIPVEVTIEEAPRLSARVGVGYGREDEFRTFLDIDYLNFPGRTQRSRFYAKHSALEPYRFEATVIQPAVFGPRSSMSLSPYLRRRTEPGFESLVYGATLTALQNFTKTLSMSASLYFDRVDIDITSKADETLQKYSRSTYTKNGLSVGGLFNTVKPRFDPLSGWSVAVNTSVNSPWLGSVYPFFKYLFEVKRFQPITNGLILAARIKLGSIQPITNSDVTPFEERFFAGGSQSVRGWSRQMLSPLDEDGIPIGGNSLFEGSLEPRIKIFGPVSLVVFFDYGNVWESANHFPPGEIRFAAGTGLRVSTPIGPVGIDFARPVFDEATAWQFHLNIGHAF